VCFGYILLYRTGHLKHLSDPGLFESVGLGFVWLCWMAFSIFKQRFA
jgi:hypothetical protein